MLTLTLLIIFSTQTLHYEAPTPEYFEAEITAYTAHPSETDSTPHIVASGKKTRLGMIACPSWLSFGTKVLVEGLGIYICEDRMALRFRHGAYFDVLMETKKLAKEWGRQTRLVAILQ